MRGIREEVYSTLFLPLHKHIGFMMPNECRLLVDPQCTSIHQHSQVKGKRVLLMTK